MFDRKEFDILNLTTLSRTVKDFFNEEDAINYVRSISKYGNYELYNQFGHKVVMTNPAH